MKEIGTKTKYSKIQQMMSLPDKRPLDKTKQIIFEKTPITQQQSLYVNASILRKRNDLIDQLQQQLELFTTTQYKFPFPESKFPNVPEGQRNNISYAQKVQVQEEDTFQNRLNDQQIQQIKQRGQFEVKSKAYNATIPYVWKINGCILRGRLKRILIFENGLAWCYNLMDTAVIKLKQLVPKGFRDFLNMPIKLFAIIFGKKQLSPLHQPDYSRQICKDFWTDIMNDELKDIQNEVGHEFLKLLYLPYEKEVYKYVDQGISGEVRTLQQKNKNEKTKIYNQNITKIYQFKETIRRVETGFETHWLKIRKRILTKVSNESDEALNQKLISLQNDEQPLKQQVRKKDRAILERLYEQKFLIYTAHIRQNFKNQNINGNIIQTLMFLMLLFATIQRKILLKNEKLKQIQGGLRQKIDKKYPVRSKNKKFKERKFKKQYQLIKQEIQAEFFDKLLIDVINKDNFNQKYQSIYAKYINLVKNFDKLVEQKKENLTSLYTPSRVFRTTYILFPPYQVVQTNSYFSLKRKQEMRIDTSSHFWKCSLYAMRLKSWTLNCFKFLLGVCWAGPLGFRSLFGIQNFKFDQDCNSQTGVKYEIKRTPFLGRFCKVLRGIKKSRARFEGQPDRGLFGKNCSRICNYIECYIFRLLIVGVILVLMLYPVGIILFSIICLIGVLTAWIWVPLAMVLCYLFNIFIFQFQVSSSGEGCLIRSVPLLSLLIQIFFAIFKIIGPIIFLLIIAPLICLGYFLYLIVQRIVRTISDTVMLCLIGCFGRTPSRDSSIAKKISGPGLSRNYFFSIAEQDVYILTQAALQKIIANKYIQMTRKKIKQGTIKYNALTSTVLKPFGISQPNLNKKVDLINANNNELLNNFNKQAGYYLARYPSNPHGVRFTQQQIQLYFDNCVKIVKNFVKRQDAQGWIFQERGLLNEDYQELTRVIWTDIFNCGDEIFEPLQKIDNRFKLIDQEDDANNSNQMQKNVNSIMQALQGEVELNERKPNFTPIKRSLLERDYPINYIAQICELHTNNSETRINVNIQDPTCLLVCPRNLQQLKLYDIYQKEQLIRTHPKIIEK